MLGTIFGKLYGFVLEKVISQWAKLKGVRVRGQVGFREGRYTLDHILTLYTLIIIKDICRSMSPFLPCRFQQKLLT